MKRILKIVAGVFLTIVVLCLCLYALILLPAVQQKMKDYACQKIEHKLGLQLEVGTISPFFYGVKLSNVLVCNTQSDTLLQTQTLYASLNRMNLDSGFVSLQKVKMTDMKYWLDRNTAGELNLKSLLNAVASSDSVKNPFCFRVEEVDIQNGEFRYYDFTKTPVTDSAMDYYRLSVDSLYIQGRELEITNQTYSMLIDHLACREKCGFSMQHFQAEAFVCDTVVRCNNLKINTPQSQINAKHYAMSYNRFLNFYDYCNKVRMLADFNQSLVAFPDIAYFAPQLCGMPYRIGLEGFVQGEVVDLLAQNLKLNYGNQTEFLGSLHITGLPQIEKTTFSVNVKSLKTNVNDICETRISPYSEPHFVQIPEFLKNLQTLSYIGSVSGKFSDLSVLGRVQTNVGNLRVDGNVTQSVDKNNCFGTLNFDNIDLSEFIHSTDLLKRMSGNATFAVQFNADSLINAEVKSKVSKLECNKYPFSNIDVDGKYSAQHFRGRVNVHDPNLQMRFGGGVDFSGKNPEFKFGTLVEHAKLYALNLVADSLAEISLYTRVNLRGMDFENLNGKISVNDVHYKNARGEVSTEKITAEFGEEQQQRSISLQSDFVDAHVIGSGNYVELWNRVLAVVNQHVTALPNAKLVAQPSGDFRLQADVKNINRVLAIVQPKLQIASGSQCEFRYNVEQNSCSLMAKSPRIDYQTMKFRECDVFASSSGNGISVEARCAINEADENPSILHTQCFAVNDSLKIFADWNVKSAIKTYGKVSLNGKMNTTKKGRLPQFAMNILPTQMYFYDSLWNMSPSSVVVDTTSISLVDFGVWKDTKKITFNGVVSQNPDDYVVVSVENYDLRELNPIINHEKVRLSGQIQGTARVKNLYNTPLMFANVSSPEITFNEHSLGSLKLRTFWDNPSKSLFLQSSIVNGENPLVEMRGKYRPKEDSIYTNLKINSLNLNTIAEVLQGTVNDLQGEITGEVEVFGKPQSLLYSGNLYASEGAFVVDYTKIPYTFSGPLTARKSRSFMFNFDLFDVNNNKSAVSGYFDLSKLRNPQYRFDVRTPKMLAMKTTATDNDYFYGTIYYNGTVRIEGDLYETKISADGRMLDNSVCSIPVMYSELSGVYDFLYFAEDSTQLFQAKSIEKSSGLILDLMLALTPETQAQIVFDPKVGDIIKARGNGDLRVKMDTDGDLRVYGKYQIEEGDYLFTLKNLINKKLILQKGGTIVWNGDPLNAQVDFVANYETKASPQPLFDSTVNASKRIPVTCQAYLKNNLMSPDISYDIAVPSSATQVQEVLATLNEDEKTLQFFSLLLQGSFNSVASLSGGSLSLEMLGNQINNLMSQIDPNLDVSMNYRIGAGAMSSNEFEFGISRNFWNDRIVVNVNGYTDFGGSNSNKTATNSTQNNDFSGNVSVEMKVNKQGTVRVKAFSRSNESILSEKQENTQGVGLFYTKDYNTVRDLFERKRKRRNEF